MAKVRALASGPIAFSSTSQLLIPVSAITFDDGAPSYAPPSGTGQETAAQIAAWLQALAAEGVLTAAPAPPVQPAMILTATSPGAAGNAVTITISNVRPKPTDASTTIFDATVREVDRYEQLTAATISTVLGTSAGGGEHPGLAFVSSGAPSHPKNGTYPLVGDPATVDVAKSDGSAGAFTLESRAGGAEAALTAAVVSDADDAEHPDTFTLEITWEKSATGIAAGDFDTEFDYAITADAPQGGSLSAPAAGTYTLGGGADATSAAAASATLPAGA